MVSFNNGTVKNPSADCSLLFCPAYAPYWLRKEDDVMYVVLREPVTIEFWVYGYPEPSIQWSFNDVEVSFATRKLGNF